ncbi:ACP phosphodiesterase [Microcoleus sp. FACHB-831]|uniref:acyl carrier protein phosphodiesterase n=1 Tax=Microcoleus sp. FACHB-831 TaxID=2692827 RepID=UPI001F54983D|nr:ACP phosphodiesterase [Microcoleus sp. FACHB-831]
MSNEQLSNLILYIHMNYLAHLYLADNSPESILGNLLGDFVKGQAAFNIYPMAIKKGIQLHRQVDAYTDSHAVVRESKKLISNINKRYAGIIIDVFYDHFLAKNWSTYSSIPLNEFAANVYAILQDNHHLLPPSLIEILPRIIGNNVLMSYADIQGIGNALKRISLRLKRENSLGDATEDLRANYERLESDFSLFFTDLTEYTYKVR